MRETNWAGNHTYRAERIVRPTSVDELASVVARAHRVRALGSRHSFTDIVDTDTIVDMSALPRPIDVSDDRKSVIVAGNATYAGLAPALAASNLALHNLASLPHLSIAGAVATGTHGSGDANGNLATAVRSIEILTADGELLHLDDTDDRFAGAVVSMGALGVVTRLELAVEPSYEVRQHVFEGVGVDMVGGSFDEIFGSGYSVSAFTRWRGDVEQIWVKSRVDAPPPAGGVLASMRAAKVQRHPIIEHDAEGCTPQLGAPGPWHERLPHFRAGTTPSAGAEIQSEYFVPRVEAASAIDALQRIGDRLASVLMVSEIRTIAADHLWMSPHSDDAAVGFHFTWRPDPDAVAGAVQVVEDALAPFAPRPHWGKVFTAETFDAAEVYRYAAEFERLRAELDPSGTFSNAWTRRILGR